MTSYNILEFVIPNLVIPVALVTWIWIWRNKCKLDWLLKFIIIFLYLVLSYLCGFRDPLNYFLRYITTFVYFTLSLVSYLRVRRLPFYSKKNVFGWIRLSIYFVLISVIAIFCIQPIDACIYKSEPINLDFPFKNGMYLIQQGGDGKGTSILNHHYSVPVFVASGSNKSMRYAVDIEKLNSSGITSKTRFSKNIEDYEIFNEALYSPCDGVVESISDGMSNESMTSDNHPVNSGNTIIIKSGGVYVLMGHLQRNSFTVKCGDKVKKGDLIARIGNSGMTSGPHLHMQAMKDISWTSEGVPIIFNGYFPVKNDIIIR